ncbi:MAG TPA: glutathione transferase GstA [Gallionella sp.]|nr:glutathione transferase GstA [Gallionella sp.]
MKLYYSPGACSLASHIALQETGLPYEIEKVDFATKLTATGDDFNRINPKSYVPTIRLDDGSILTEGPAILQYIADRQPAANLAPAAGTMERYRLQEWLTFIGTEIHKSFSPLFNKASPEETKTAFRNRIALRLGYVESQLQDKPYLLGEYFSVADAYLFTVTRWSAFTGVDLVPFPRLRDYMVRIGERPAVQAAMHAEGLKK